MICHMNVLHTVYGNNDYGSCTMRCCTMFRDIYDARFEILIEWMIEFVFDGMLK